MGETVLGEWWRTVGNPHIAEQNQAEVPPAVAGKYADWRGKASISLELCRHVYA
jgi:hypothetical protein